MSNKKVYWIYLAAAALLLAALACGRQQAGPTATPEVIVVTATPGAAGEPPPSLEPTAPLEPTSTPLPGGCTTAMQFVANVSVPDGTTFAANAPFIKTWRVRNSGTCNWSGYRLIFDHGEPMGTMEQPIEDVAAGQEVEISVEMTAPGGDGHYRGYWRIQSPEGANLGTIYCDIVVGSSAAPPVQPPTEPPAQPPTEPPAQPPAAGSPPANLRVSGWGMHSLTFAWDDATGEAGYILMVGSESVDLPADTTSYTWPNLQCGAAVNVTLIARNASGAEIGRLSLNANTSACLPQTVTLQSLPAEDGTVRGVATGEIVDMDGDIRVGDGPQNRGGQGFFSFDISGLPAGATIQQATLDLSGYTVAGDPFGTPGLHRLGVYIVLYDQLGVELYTPGLPPGPIVTLSGPPSTINVTSLLQPYIGSRNRFQVRVQFEVITDNDSTADALVYPEGGPALTVTFVP